MRVGGRCHSTTSPNTNSEANTDTIKRRGRRFTSECTTTSPEEDEDEEKTQPRKTKKKEGPEKPIATTRSARTGPSP
eukprot:3925357-Pyramimonas_sp.AAC.1